MTDHEEDWRSIPNFSRYKVSCCGFIRRAIKMRTRAKHTLLARAHDSDGYLRTMLYNDQGKLENRGVHQLVARAFLSPSKMTWVLHKDDNKANNNYQNLKWGNVAINFEDAARNGSFKPKSGEAHCCSKLTWEIVRDLRKRYIPKVVTCKMLAEEYGVTLSLVHLVVTNKHWIEK